MKLSIEKVREWFTPIQACYYLFEDADRTINDELLIELANLVNSFKLPIFIYKFHFEPVPRVMDNGNDNEDYLAMIAYYNENNFIKIPPTLSNVNIKWMEMVVNKDVIFHALIPDVYNFTEEYKADKNFSNNPFPDERNPKDCNIHFEVIVNSFELGFNKEVLDQYIQDQLYPKNKTPRNSVVNSERDSMIKIIHGLAKNGYRYPSHGSIIDMVKDFQLNKNGVSEKTLKKYLDEFDKL